MVASAGSETELDRRAVFLDRDGIVNRALVRDGRPFPPQSLDELEILPGVVETIAQLKSAGFLVIVATNQPDVASGKQDRSVVEAIHAHLLDHMELDDIRVCFHSKHDGCTCHKPKPGLLVAAAADWGIDLSRSHMVGDRWRDIGAGQAVGCRTYFVDYDYDEKRPIRPDVVVKDLAHAGRLILSDGPNLGD